RTPVRMTLVNSRDAAVAENYTGRVGASEDPAAVARARRPTSLHWAPGRRTRMVRYRLVSVIIMAVSAAASAAHANTIETGGNVINETWTPAGSPYIVQGDITVPSGAFLTIEAG